MSSKTSDKSIAVTIGSGNVFADLGMQDPEADLAKAKLAHEICNLIERKRLTQTRAALILRTAQPEVSRLMRGHLHRFSTGKLLGFLMALGRDVQISHRAARSKAGASLWVVSESPSSSVHERVALRAGHARVARRKAAAKKVIKSLGRSRPRRRVGAKHPR